MLTCVLTSRINTILITSYFDPRSLLNFPMNVIARVLTLVQLASFVLLPVILRDFPSPGLFKKKKKKKKNEKKRNKKAEEKSEELREDREKK